jgi:hypothetical protein
MKYIALGNGKRFKVPEVAELQPQKIKVSKQFGLAPAALKPWDFRN